MDVNSSVSVSISVSSKSVSVMISAVVVSDTGNSVSDIPDSVCSVSNELVSFVLCRQDATDRLNDKLNNIAVICLVVNVFINFHLSVYIIG